MPYMQHQFQGTTVACHEIGDRLTIGRGPDNDLVIDDATASIHHAVVEKDGDGFRIRDLGSTNGVLVNGKKTGQADITEGDAIVIGTHDLQLVLTLSNELAKTLIIKKSWIPGVYYTEE